MKMGSSSNGNSIPFNEDDDNYSKSFEENYAHFCAQSILRGGAALPVDGNETYSYSRNIQGGATPPTDDNETYSYSRNIQGGATPPTDDNDTYYSCARNTQGRAALPDDEIDTYSYAPNVPGRASPPVNESEESVVNSSETTRTYSRLKVRILMPIITSLYFCHGTFKPVLFQYLLERWSLEAGYNSSVHKHSNTCGRNESHHDAKEADAIQSRVADVSVYYTWCSSGPALLTCLVFGALVDLIGRKPALVLSQLGTTLQLLTIVIVIRFNLNTDFLYLAYTLDGVGGSFILFMVANLSSTADVSDSKKSRILWITIVLTSSHVFVSGADIAIGEVIKYFGYVAAALTVFAPVALSLLISIFLLPETLLTKRQKVSLKKVWEHNSRVLFLYTRDGSRETRWSLFFSLLIFFTTKLDHVSLTKTDTLYQKHEPLCWNSVKIGYYEAFRNATRGICGLLYLWISRRIGCASDEVNSMASTLFLGGGFMMEAFSRNDWEMFMAPVISIPSANIAPITRGVMSFLAGPAKQGALFSSIAVVEVICDVLGHTAYGKLYAATVGFMPGTVYFVMAAVALVTFLLYIPFFHFYERPMAYKDLQ